MTKGSSIFPLMKLHQGFLTCKIINLKNKQVEMIYNLINRNLFFLFMMPIMNLAKKLLENIIIYFTNIQKETIFF